MTGETQVVEDATVDQEREPTSSPPRLWVVLAFVVGLAFGAVFFGPTVNPAPDPVQPDANTPLAPGLPIGAVGVATAIPEFPDAVVAITQNGSAAEYLLWPQARGPSGITLPVEAERPIRIDVSGVWVAMTQLVPDATGDILSVGRAAGLSATVSGVGSIAWHDSAHGTLGFTRFLDGRWGLWRTQAFFNPHLVADLGSGGDALLHAWGDWGWAIGRGGEGVDVMAPDGSTSRSFDGLLGSGPSAAVVESGRTVMLVPAAGPPVPLELPEGLSGSPVTAAVSPDGARVAVLTPRQAVVVGRDGTPVRLWDDLRAPRGPLAWSSDSRFLLVPLTPRGVAALDIETGSATTVLDDFAVRWLGVIPLSGPS